MSVYAAIRNALNNSVPVSIVTIVRGEGAGSKLVVLPDKHVGTLGSGELDDRAIERANALLEDHRSLTETIPLESGEIDLFFETFPAPPTLLIFGAVHTGQALATLGKLLDFRVIVSDARAALLTEERFPMADQLILGWPEDALAQIAVDRNTYIAILTHDPKFDEPAILGSFATNARYIGAAGSRKTSEERKGRLANKGATEEQIARLRGPIGLNIGARTPEEMAISIFAEIIAVQHNRDGQPLVSAKGNVRPRD